jgi:hypothetical protein
MDPNVLNFLLSFAAGIGANITTATFQKVLSAKPDIASRLTAPKSTDDVQAALADIAGVLEALAGSGMIAVDGAAIVAFRSARFDHEHGQIRIGNTVISAPTLQTGGTGSGQTTIGGNTMLKSQGTSINVGQGASITITGNAGIKQS